MRRKAREWKFCATHAEGTMSELYYGSCIVPTLCHSPLKASECVIIKVREVLPRAKKGKKV